MKQLTYVGPFDAIDVQTNTDELGNPVVTEVARHTTVDVADELAGRPPSSEFVQAHDLVVALHHAEATPGLSDEERGAAQKALAEARALLADADRGEGLLAQPDNWQPATSTKASKTPASEPPAPAAADATDTGGENR